METQFPTLHVQAWLCRLLEENLFVQTADLVSFNLCVVNSAPKLVMPQRFSFVVCYSLQMW